jgi:hypothetical protein
MVYPAAVDGQSSRSNGQRVEKGAESLDQSHPYEQQATMARQNLMTYVNDVRSDMLRQRFAPQVFQTAGLSTDTPSLFQTAAFTKDTTFGAPVFQPPGIADIDRRTADAADRPAPQSFTPRPPQVTGDMPPEVQEQIARINRLYDGQTGQGRRQFTPQQASELFAPRTVPRQTRSDNETVAVAAMKDIVSGFISRDERDPYHSVKNWDANGDRIGRYGISAAQYRSWLVGQSDQQINELMAEGKLARGSAELAQYLRAHPDGADPNGQLQGNAKAINDFLNKMQAGDPLNKPTALEIDRYLNQNLQEKMGSDIIRSYAKQTADVDPEKGGLMANIPKIALSMYLGHPVTNEEAADPRFKQFVDAALKQWPLAVQKEQGVPQIDVSNLGRNIAAVAEANYGRALWQGSGTGANLGCVSSVSNILRQSGAGNIVEINVGVIADHLQKNWGWKRDSWENRQPGDVIILGNYNVGHVGIVGANREITYDNHSATGQWSRDGAQFWVNYGNRIGIRPYVLHPPTATA